MIRFSSNAMSLGNASKDSLEISDIVMSTVLSSKEGYAQRLVLRAKTQNRRPTCHRPEPAVLATDGPRGHTSGLPRSKPSTPEHSLHLSEDVAS